MKIFIDYQWGVILYQNYGFEKYINRDSLRDTIKYVVEKGDTLYEIAKKYNVDVGDIVSLNNLASSMIYPNQILFIPKRNKVESCKTISLKDFLLKNGYDIKGYPDDVLNIEVLDTKIIKPSHNTYTIVATDSLDSIISKTGLTPYELLNLNKDKWLRVGETIIIK